MQKITSVIVAISFLLVTACGRIDHGKFAAAQMSEEQATEVLAQVVDQSQVAPNDTEAVTPQNLAALIQDLADQGKLNLPSEARGAISSNGTVNTDTLNKVLSMLSQGMSAFQVAMSVVNSAGSTSQAKFNLDTVLAILQAAMPFIAGIAPQFVPVIQAVITMVPIIKAFIGLFKKPTAAYWSIYHPVHA